MEADGTLTVLRTINRGFPLKLGRLLEGPPEFVRVDYGNTLIVNEGFGSTDLPVNVGATSLLEEREMTFSTRPPKSLPTQGLGEQKVHGSAVLVDSREMNFIQAGAKNADFRSLH